MPTTALPFTPLAVRHPSPHGQGTVTYAEYNARPRESISAQEAPSPIRQGDTPARPARMPIAIMSTDVRDWNIGFPDAFLPYNKVEIPQNQAAGRGGLNLRSQNPVGIRPNIERGTVSAYGSMFALSGSTYDESRG